MTAGTVIYGFISKPLWTIHCPLLLLPTFKANSPWRRHCVLKAISSWTQNSYFFPVLMLKADLATHTPDIKLRTFTYRKHTMHVSFGNERLCLYKLAPMSLVWSSCPLTVAEHTLRLSKASKLQTRKIKGSQQGGVELCKSYQTEISVPWPRLEMLQWEGSEVTWAIQKGSSSWSTYACPLGSWKSSYKTPVLATRLCLCLVNARHGWHPSESEKEFQPEGNHKYWMLYQV